jgi:hypothetical protein
MPRRRALGQAFRERLAESTPSAKLMVRGRASRSRRKSDVATRKAIADYLPITQARAISKSRALYISKYEFEHHGTVFKFTDSPVYYDELILK